MFYPRSTVPKRKSGGRKTEPYPERTPYGKLRLLPVAAHVERSQTKTMNNHVDWTTGCPSERLPIFGRNVVATGRAVAL